MANLYPHLLSPISIRGHLFKNRILGGPLGFNQENLTAAMSQDNIDYFGALARGGAARVTTGDCMVADDAGYGGGGGRPKYYAPAQEILNSIKAYVNTVHRYNCQAFVQLAHNGPELSMDYVVEGNMATPSEKAAQIAQALNGYSAEKLHSIIDDFVRCARNLKMGGIDGIIVHGGHGAKIIDQLRSPLTNERTDEYGGSLENRCRFTLELMRALRKEVGEDVILELRFSASEYTEGGITTEQTIEFLKLLEAEHTVDIFHISGGMHIAPLSNMYTISPGLFPSAVFRQEVKKIRAAGIKTPLALINSLADPAVGEDVLASGDADFVVLSRQINLADPYYPRKLQAGHPELIDNCLRCHGCYDVVGPCSVNPYATVKTYESSYELPLAKTKRKLCVVGGGIAGLKAAYTAAERGHQVILLEKEAVLGGQLRFADTDTYKMDIRRYKNNMIKRCEDHPNIEIRLNTTVTPDVIKAELPCSLIVAVGAEQKSPPIPGADSGKLLTVMESYLHPEKIGQKVVMLGNGLTACEVGLHLNRLGKNVTIVGRQRDLCFHEGFHVMPTAVFSPIPFFYDAFAKNGTLVLNSTEAVKITGRGLVVRDVNGGEERLIEADTVILAAGSRARTEEALAFHDVGADYFAMAGDCIKAHKIRDAVSTGFWAAMEV